MIASDIQRQISSTTSLPNKLIDLNLGRYQDSSLCPFSLKLVYTICHHIPHLIIRYVCHLNNPLILLKKKNIHGITRHSLVANKNLM